MNIKQKLWEIAEKKQKKTLPILSFPAVKKLGVSVEQMLMSAELQADVMEFVANNTQTVAAVSPMDLSIEAQCFGADVQFEPDEVPNITGALITSKAEANALGVPDITAGRAPLAIEGVKLAKKKINSKFVLAGMIGPFSLAGRLMDVTEIMYTCFDEPDLVHTVLKKATEFLINYATAFKTAGADGIVMAEPLTGILSPDMAYEFSVPYVKEIIKAVQSDGFSVIYHNCGGTVTDMLNGIFSQGADAYHFGNAVDMQIILQSAPSDVLCMGNIDPVSQFANGTPDSVAKATRQLFDKCKDYKNFIISSGCDIPSHTNWNNITAFFNALEN